MRSISARGPAVNTPKYLILILLLWFEGNEPSTQGVHSELGSTLRSRLAQGFRDVDLDRASGESKLVRDRLVAEPGNEQPDNLDFAFRERLVPGAHGE